MDSEAMTISDECAQMINATKDRKNKVLALRTTTINSLESSVYTNGHVKQFDGWTNKFIFPPYDFQVQMPCYQFPSSQSSC